MKKFIISYIFISILFALALYFITLTLSYNARVYDVFQELSEEAVASKDFDHFVSYQSIAYHRISSEDSGDYRIFIYQIVGTNDGGYMNQVGVFILPLSDVTYADAVDDPNDQTRMVIIDQSSSLVIFDTTEESEYHGFAVSYGLMKIGYYFYTIDLSSNQELRIILNDYDGNVFYDQIHAFIYEEYPLESSSFQEGLTKEALDTLIDQEVPSNITNLQIAQLKNTIFWTPSIDDYGVEKYAIYVDGNLYDHANLNQYTFNRFEAGRTYQIQIQAIDFVGRTSEKSSVLSLTVT